MSLGESRMAVTAAGGQQKISAAKLARTVVHMGVSPGGTPNTIYRFGDQASMLAALDAGPLSEDVAPCLRPGLTSYVIPLTPSSAGGLSAAVTQTGTGAGTVTPTVAPHKLVEVVMASGGIVGTSAYKYRVGGVGNFSAPIATAATARIPGTFCTVSFPAGTYVVNETYSIGVDGVITRSNGTTGPAITQASSPLGTWDVQAKVVKAGALGVAALRISLDGGNSTLPDFAIPSSGKIIIPNTGLVLTCASTFAQDDVYAFNACEPGFSTSDVTAAIAVARADKTVAAVLVVVHGTPGSAASAISLAATVDAQLLAAFNSDGIDWNGMVGCPVVGDIVMSGSNAIVDAADTDTVIRTAREGQDLIRTACCPAQHRVTSVIGGAKLKQSFVSALVQRFVDTDPRDDLSALEPNGPLGIFAIGRDESSAQNLDDVQFCVARTYRNRNGAFLAITAGGFGYKNLTTNAAFQDAGGFRALNAALPALRAAGLALLGQRPLTNSDGTIDEKVRRAWSAKLDGVFKRACGLMPGGDFTKPQLSIATATVLASSQLGQSPHRLDIQYTAQTLGFVSDVSGTVQFSGVINVGA
jgi:hypothetical protein